MGRFATTAGFHARAVANFRGGDIERPDPQDLGLGASLDFCLKAPPPKVCDKESANPRKPDWYTVGWKNMGMTYDQAGSAVCLNFGLSTPASMPLGAGWDLNPK